MDSIEIINKILYDFNITAKEFADTLGLSRPDIIYHILRGRNGISKALANKISKKYNISYNWLLTGEGEMINNINNINNGLENINIPHEHQDGSSPKTDDMEKLFNRFLSIIENKDKQFDELIAANKDAISQQKEMIALHKELIEFITNADEKKATKKQELAS